MLKNLFVHTLPLAGVGIFALTCAQAQVQPNLHLRKPPVGVSVDGSLKDWGDSLYYYNAEKKLNYTLANDAQNLYVAIRFNDRSEQERVLMAGLTLGINTKGKKKDEYTVTFPVADENTPKELMAARTAAEGADGQPDRDEMRRARLSRLRNIKVTGFKDIDYDILTTTNTLGFKAAVDFDAEGNLVYEAVIPLKFFSANNAADSEWAFNFKVNGITRNDAGDKSGGQIPGGGLGMGGRGGGGMGRGGGGMGGGRGGRGGGGMGRGTAQGADRSSLSKSEDFWEKFYLANR